MSDGMEWERCPEHGPMCSGAICCCRDKHPGYDEATDSAPEPLAQWEKDLLHGTTPFEQALDSALAEVRELMVSRHAKYGPGNIARHGELGLLVRLGDKYERLDNNREDLEDESVDDTVDDIIGYGVIWKLWRKGQWPGQKALAE